MFSAGTTTCRYAADSAAGTGLNYVVLSGKTICCGRPGDPATEQRYNQAIGEWLAAGRQLLADPTTLTIKELTSAQLPQQCMMAIFPWRWIASKRRA